MTIQITDIRWHQESNQLELALSNGRVGFIDFDTPLLSIQPQADSILITHTDHSSHRRTHQQLITEMSVLSAVDKTSP